VASPSMLGLMAKISSSMTFCCSLSVSSLILRVSGCIPSIGDIRPPRTW